MTSSLEALLEYEFKDPSLLQAALCHPSLSGKRPSVYERLEFLGDRVLSLVIADLLFHFFPSDSEGDLSRRHTTLVRREALASVATHLRLGDFVGVARGENPWGNSILSDACEALIGALYLEAGLGEARRFISRFWEPLIHASHSDSRDPKSALQEWAQGRKMDRPQYIIQAQQGPAHSPSFEVKVILGKEEAVGAGTSKRNAEQVAAALLLERLSKKEKK